MEALARAEEHARVPMLALTREFQESRAQFLAACERVLSRMHLLGGEELKAFESEMAAFLGVRQVRGVGSGTDALRLAVRASGLKAGDEVLIQANAFVAAVEALHDAGVRPIPVDIQESDLGPDPAELRSRITPRTRGILVVHLYGFPVDLSPVLALVQERELILLEDCSHAHGAMLDGKRVGSFGAAGAFSLGVVKNLAAYGDGGIVATNDDAIAERVKLLGTHGQVKKNEHAFYGTNSRLDELHAAMLRVKLRTLDDRNARRAAIAAYYTEQLAGLVTPPPSDPRRTHVYHQYVIRTPRREALRRHLDSIGVETGVHYPIPVHRQMAWRDTYGVEVSLPRAEEAAAEILSLPVHPDLTDVEVERVASGVRGFFR